MNLPCICRQEESWIYSWPTTITSTPKVIDNRPGRKCFWSICTVVSLHPGWKNKCIPKLCLSHLVLGVNGWLRRTPPTGIPAEAMGLPPLPWLVLLIFSVLNYRKKLIAKEAPLPVIWKIIFSMRSLPTQVSLWFLTSLGRLEWKIVM